MRESRLGRAALAGAACAALVSLALSGCASAPVQQMSNARQAVRAAKKVDAAHYAPRIYAEAVHWLDDADYAIKHRDYARAHKSAARAEHAARAASLAARKARASPPATVAPPSGSGP